MKGVVDRARLRSWSPWSTRESQFLEFGENGKPNSNPAMSLTCWPSAGQWQQFSLPFGGETHECHIALRNLLDTGDGIALNYKSPPMKSMKQGQGFWSKLTSGRTSEILVTRHRGELRENGGSWVIQKAPLPRDDCRYFHPQFRLRDKCGGLASGSHSDNPPLEPRQVNTVLLKGPPEKEDRCYYLRVSKVFGLMDLFSAWGHEYTAKELYAYYLSCRIFAHKRQNQNKCGRQ